MAELTHHNTVTIYDYGRTEDGVFYYAMEYLDGLDLEHLVEVGGPQPAARVIHILRQAAGALGEAHARGLIHRDVKPANLFLCGAEFHRLRVLDFGLVKDSRSTAGTTDTGEHTFLGSPLYMSPESIARPTQVDARSDLYSLAAVGYMLITGQPVFDGSTVAEVCAQHLFSVPTAPSERLGRAAPEDLEQLIMACLSKRPEDRPESASELLLRLEACADATGWSAADAQAWWLENRPRSEALRAARSAKQPSEQTAVQPLAVTVAYSREGHE